MLKVRRSTLYTLWFRWYSRRQFQKHFNAVYTFGTDALKDMDLSTPVIFYANHAYWWDGFWSQLCTETYFRQNLYIIIEYKQLVRYQFFTRLGAFSIVRENPREAIETINYAAELLTMPSEKQNALWIFPQGAIEHIDKRPVNFYSGTATIAKRVAEKHSKVYLCSLVTRVDYNEEQKPDMFLSFKPPVLADKLLLRDTKAVTKQMQELTELHMDELKTRIMNRDLQGAHTLVAGKLSVNKKLDRFRMVMGIEKSAS
ncbi:MAG: glycerol acyltransferase [Desulfobulbaceae bacterium]|jgi:chlorobactene lauroyltransferase|nr:glycerol acyltransferase [Desulfobulbaceae bacterium]